MLSIGSIVGIVYTGLCAHRLLYKELLLTDAGCECLLTLFAPGGDLGRQSMQRDPFLHGSPVLLIVTHAESDSCALYLMDCRAWPIFRESLVAAFHASESIQSLLYSSQQPQGILQTSSVCVGCGPYLPKILPGPLGSSRKAFSAYLSASLLFQRSCLMALDCTSFRWDSIIAFSTIYQCGQRVT